MVCFFRPADVCALNPASSGSSVPVGPGISQATIPPCLSPRPNPRLSFNRTLRRRCKQQARISSSVNTPFCHGLAASRRHSTHLRRFFSRSMKAAVCVDLRSWSRS